MIASASIHHTEIAIAAYALLVLTLIVAASVQTFGATASRAGQAFPIIFLAASAALVVFARRDFIRYEPSYNVDEAFLAANAMRARFGWLNWNLVDPLTSGPLNSSVLAWPPLFGWDITLFSARLTAIVSFVAGSFFLFLALCRMAGDTVALLVVAPAVVFFAATTDPNFLHANSETLPFLLTSVAVWLFVLALATPGAWPALGCAVVLGMVPFAKLQAAPIAAALGLCVCAACLRPGPNGALPAGTGQLVAVVVAALLPAALFIVPLCFVPGGVTDFYNSYLLQQVFRAEPWTNMLPWLISEGRSYRAMLAAELVLVVLGLALVLFTSGWRRMSRLAGWCLAAGLLMSVASVAAVAATARPYVHYLLLTAAPVLLLAGAALTAGYQAAGNSRTRVAVLTAGGLAVIGIMAHMIPGQRLFGNWYARGEGAFLLEQPYRAADSFAWLLPRPDDRIVCWGWVPDCYVSSAMTPATRETTNENILYGTPLRPYFAARFLADFDRSRPDIVIDMVSWDVGFRFRDPDRFSIATNFPEFFRTIQSDFQLVSRADPGRCPRTYIRKERLAELNRHLIPIERISASMSAVPHSPEALDDNSTSDVCGDNWVLSPNTTGAVEFAFRGPEPVRTIRILNTRAAGDGRAQRIRLTLQQQGRMVVSREVDLAPYPRWTTVHLDAASTADEARIDITSFAGSVAGLNEVKFYR